jgi:uncharacterized protein
MASEPRVLVDTGPLVAAFNASDRHHAWALEQLKRIPPPFATCEAVLSEVCFLVRGAAQDRVLALFTEGHGRLVSLHADTRPIRSLMAKYRSVPMSYADACMVRLAELLPRLSIMTVDSDFLVYRRNGNRRLKLIAPF